MRCAAWDRQPRTTYLQRLDGRIKTCVLLGAIVIVSVLTRWPLVAGVLLITLALMSTLHLPPRKVLWRMSVPIGVAWLVLLSLIFTTGHTVIGIINLWHISLPIYRGGITLGILITLRTLAAVSLAMLLSFSTPMVEILATLRLFKIPAVIPDLADMIYRYAFSLEEMAAAMRKAQRARGGEGLPWHRQARDTGIIAGNLMIKAFDRSVRIYKAMLARGYDEDAKTPPHYTSPVPAKDILAGTLAALVLISLLVCNFGSSGFCVGKELCFYKSYRPCIAVRGKLQPVSSDFGLKYLHVKKGVFIYSCQPQKRDFIRWRHIRFGKTHGRAQTKAG